MPRPPGEQLERCVDANAFAHAELQLVRDCSLDVLPRLQEAGAGQRTRLQLKLQFLRVADSTAIEGTLSGQLELVCQRCLGPVQVELQESFKVILVADEAALAREYHEYEPILVDATRLDLQWLAEEQGLLALPLVARHPPDMCGVSEQSLPTVDTSTQRPFGNLRDLMRGR